MQLTSRIALCVFLLCGPAACAPNANLATSVRAVVGGTTVKPTAPAIATPFGGPAMPLTSPLPFPSPMASLAGLSATQLDGTDITGPWTLLTTGMPALPGPRPQPRECSGEANWIFTQTGTSVQLSLIYRIGLNMEMGDADSVEMSGTYQAGQVILSGTHSGGMLPTRAASYTLHYDASSQHLVGVDESGTTISFARLVASPGVTPLLCH